MLQFFCLPYRVDAVEVVVHPSILHALGPQGPLDLDRPTYILWVHRVASGGAIISGMVYGQPGLPRCLRLRSQTIPVPQQTSCDSGTSLGRVATGRDTARGHTEIDPSTPTAVSGCKCSGQQATIEEDDGWHEDHGQGLAVVA
ncbi:hypothetical protein PIB30_064138 [Stylosanthes scabra]|uniref:Uncharacterized protein n=1 Tax=Stylosanthes scabra TaxID=79078 RepID=A0ABU6ZKD6_9FABA|nr:hypothetical protein [Stylosanthes scabra]